VASSSGEPGSRLHLIALSVAFWAAVAWSAIRPLNPSDYRIEIATPVGLFLILLVTRRWFPFTGLSYTLLFFEMFVLVVGAHYTHERVPLFDWIGEPLGWARNNYDRFAHFCVGFFVVIPVREFLRRATPLRGRWLAAMSVVSILAFAAFYEMTEWWIAAATSPETGAAYLGSQGDPWDAQKDMLMDWIGSVAGVIVFSHSHDAAMMEPPDSPAAHPGK
jgi:putative membrane protein